MEDVEVIRLNAARLTNLMQWKLAEDEDMKRMAMRVGGFSLVIQETWVSILKNIKLMDELPCAVSTFVTNHLEWTLLRLSKTHSKRKTLETIDFHVDAYEIADVEDKPNKHFLNQFSEIDSDWDYPGSLVMISMIFDQYLSVRDIMILKARYAEERTYDSIGLEFKISKSRVKQLHDSAIRSLQSLFANSHHLDYLIPHFIKFWRTHGPCKSQTQASSVHHQRSRSL